MTDPPTYEALRAGLIEKHGPVRQQSPDYPDHCSSRESNCQATAWRNETLFENGHAILARRCGDGHYEIVALN